MARKLRMPEEIVSLLRRAEVVHGQGLSMAAAIRRLGIIKVAFYRRRKGVWGDEGAIRSAVLRCALHPASLAGKPPMR